MTEVQRKYLEWVGYNDFEIQKVEIEIERGEEPLVFEANQFYAWENGYNKANEWHDLRKDPNDLPDNLRSVWTNVGAGYHDEDGWWCSFGRLQGVVAWCEPKFEEGEKQQCTKAKELLRKFLEAKSIEETCVAESEAEQLLKEVQEWQGKI